MPRAAHVLDVVTGGQDSVGLRVPSHPVARALLDAFRQRGIAAPSANRFGHVSPTTAQHVDADLGDEVAMILDGGACEVGIESTIVAFRGDEPCCCVPAASASRSSRACSGRAPLAADGGAPRASGTLASHYAPRTPALLVAADVLRAELAQRDDRDESVAVLARTLALPDEFDGVWIAAPREPDAYAHDLYANLRALDGADADAILIEDVPDEAQWLAVRDRLARRRRGEDDDRD